jgi:hypothetical protein
MTRSKHTSELIGCLLIALLMTTGVSYGQSQMPPATSQAGTAAPGQPSKGMGPCPCMGGEMMHGPMFMHRGPLAQWECKVRWECPAWRWAGWAPQWA